MRKKKKKNHLKSDHANEIEKRKKEKKENFQITLSDRITQEYEKKLSQKNIMKTETQHAKEKKNTKLILQIILACNNTKR